MTQEEIIKAIHADYANVLGKVIFPLEVDGYLDDDSVVVTAHGQHPFVVIHTNLTDLERPMGDGHWDPCWDVRPLYKEEFDSFVQETLANDPPGSKLRSMWVYGHCYREGSADVERAKLRFLDSFAPAGRI